MQWNATGLTRPKPSMPPSRKHHNRIRDLVLQSAGRLFNRHGFNAVSIDDVMAEAGLTRGSFYCYFASKSDLYAQPVARVVHEDREKPKDNGSERHGPGSHHRYISDDWAAGRHFAHRLGSQSGIGVRVQINDSLVR